MPNRHHLGFSPLWLRLYPELRLFESREQVREAKRAWAGHSGIVNRRMLAVIVIIVLVVGTSAAFFTVGVKSLGAPDWLATMLNVLLSALLAASITAIGWHRPYIRFVRRWLCGQGVPVCLKCGYDLRGLTDPRCPECGTVVEPVSGSSVTADESEREPIAS